MAGRVPVVPGVKIAAREEEPVSIEVVIVFICALIALATYSLPNGRRAMAAAARQIYLVTPLRRITGRAAPDHEAIARMEAELDRTSEEGGRQ